MLYCIQVTIIISDERIYLSSKLVQKLLFVLILQTRKSDLDDSIFYLENLQSQEKFISTKTDCSNVYSSYLKSTMFCADDQDHSEGKVNLQFVKTFSMLIVSAHAVKA